MADIPKPIEITHFMNPNKFFFKYTHLNDNSIEKMQMELNEFYEMNCQSHRVHFNALRKNSKVAYFCKPNWIRCEIDKILELNNVETVLMWSLDYGYPICITSDKKIKHLSSKFRHIPSPIMCGGLNVLPAEIKFKFETMSSERCRGDEWSSRACKLFKDLTKQANALLFVESATHSDIKLGNVIAIISKTSNINLTQKLIQENVAITEQADTFVLHFTRLISHSERWNDDKTCVKNIEELAPVQKLEMFSGLRKSQVQKEYFCTEMNYNMKVMDWKERNQKTLEECETENTASETISIPVQASNEIKTNVANPERSMKNLSIESKVDSNRIIFHSQKGPQQKPVFLAAGTDVGQYIEHSRFAVDRPTATVKAIAENYSKIHEEWIPKEFQIEEPVKEVISPKFDIQQGINEDIRLFKSTDVARILVHGRNLKKPVEKVSEVGFCTEIEQFLKRKNFRSVYRTQAHSWPHIIDGRPVAIINTEKTGKTYSYLLPIIDMLNDGNSKENLNTVGPVGVIFVKSSRDVDNLHEIIRNIVSNDKVSVVKAFGKLNNEAAVVGLLNTCDLLIATPDCFTRLVKDVVFDLIDRKRINHVVFDNLDLMLTKSRENIKTILKLLCDFKNPANNPQIIITTNVWINEIEKILAYSVDPIYVIGNYIESAIFGKSRFTLAKVTDEQGKCEKVYELLCEIVAKSQKTMIAVNNQEEIEVLRRFLNETKIGFQIFDNKMTPEEIKKQVEIEIDDKSVIICTDAILPSLKSIKKVQNLIHFSLSSTWTQFSYRFTVSFDYYKKVQEMSEHELTENSNNLPFSMILLDNDNNKELPRLIEFFEDHKLCKVTDGIKSMVVSILSANESLKMESGNYRIICWNLMNLGRCPKKNGSCPYRHTFSSEDNSLPSFPSSGHIKFEIINVLSAKQYCIKILQHLPPNSKKWKSMENAIKLNEECHRLMATYYKQPENVQIHHPCKINDLCCIFLDSTWNRCRVLKVQSIENIKNSTNVKIKLLDTGIILNVKSTQLMELPSFLQTYPPGVVDLYLKDLIPFDGDEMFDYESIVYLKSLLKSKMRENCFVICEISFVLLDSIFTGIIEIREHLPTTNYDLPVFSIKKHLLSTNRCCIDPDVSKNLQTLAEECGIVTKFIPKVEEIEEVVECDWSTSIEKWQELEEGSDYHVEVTMFDSIASFYIQVIDDNDNWVELLKVLDEHQERVPVTEMIEGKMVLIKRIGKLHRAKIVKAEKDITLCFCVDSGQLVSFETGNEEGRLFETTDDIINFMPFQAINCSLAGIKDICRKIDLSLVVYNQFIKMMSKKYIRVVRKLTIEGNSEMCGSFYYDVLMFDFDVDPSPTLNSVLVKRNLALYEENNEVLEEFIKKDLNEAIDQEDCDFNMSFDNLLKYLRLPPNAKLIPSIEE